MNTSSFKDIVRLQFNSLMMIIIKGRVKYHKKQIMKRSKNEVLFCEMSETERLDYVSFQVFHFTICVTDEKLATALNMLSKKQRSTILLRYFQGMNDREISELYHVSRSAIFSRRSRGLKKLKMLLSERK